MKSAKYILLLTTVLSISLTSCDLFYDTTTPSAGYSYNPKARMICAGMDSPGFVGPDTPDSGLRIRAAYDSVRRIIGVNYQVGEMPYKHCLYSYKTPGKIVKTTHFQRVDYASSDFVETFTVNNALITQMTKRYSSSTDVTVYNYSYSQGNLTQIVEMTRHGETAKTDTMTYNLTWVDGNLTEVPYFPVSVQYSNKEWPAGFVAVQEMYWLFPSQDGFLLAAGLFGNTPAKLPSTIDTGRMSSPQSWYNYTTVGESPYPVRISYESNGAGGTNTAVPVVLTWWPW